MKKKPDIRIEFPSRGTTYNRQEWGVYEYSTYPRGSVLAGQERRVFLDSDVSLELLKEKYPEAQVVQGSSFRPPNLSHLPDDTDY